MTRLSLAMWRDEEQAVRIAAQRALGELVDGTYNELQAMRSIALDLPADLPAHLSQNLRNNIRTAIEQIACVGRNERDSQLTLVMHMDMVINILNCITAVERTDDADTRRECLKPAEALHLRWSTLRLYCELLDMQMRKLMAQ